LPVRQVKAVVGHWYQNQGHRFVGIAYLPTEVVPLADVVIVGAGDALGDACGAPGELLATDVVGVGFKLLQVIRGELLFDLLLKELLGGDPALRRRTGHGHEEL
jgi:hypothetical protein